MFVCSSLGVIEQGDDTYRNSAAYMKVWAQKLKQNPSWAAKAAQKAQKACELILARANSSEAVA